MKRFSLLFFLFLISTFHAFAQTHFITAGQTQGMIYTDCIPSYFSPTFDTLSMGNRYLNGVADIDLNHDGVVDCRITYKGYHGNHFEDSFDSIYLSSNWYVYSEPDSFIGILCTDSNKYWRAKKFNYSDTLYDTPDSVWQSGDVILHSYRLGIAYGCSLGIGIGMATDSIHFYFVRSITNNDTLYGYLHFSASPKNCGTVYVYDYAIEGPESYYVFTSINDLSQSNISISPNPFTNHINISTEKLFQYTITDYSGRLLLSGTSDKTIATETIPAGSYLLVIKSEELYSVRKIVKLHE